ncbi:MAG TPA: cytochrome c oxidase assembly protein [Solirubrobacterales bacterium]|nr:cytochrome c oxidase assembly protein [Solirubrobacterales bacterium]
MTPRRGAFLLAGWLVVGVAISPPLDAAAETRLPWHMVQHGLLLAVAPPLLVLGEPVRVVLDLLPAGGARRLLATLRRRPLSLLLQPAVALSVFFAFVLATHLPVVFDAANAAGPLHGLEHVSYLFAGLLLWSAALGADPTARPLSLFGVTGLLTAAMVPMLAVGVALDSASAAVYAGYPAAEQGAGATAMWAGDLPFIAALVLAGWAAVRREERAQRLRERAGGAA